ncbi:hypothetical protein BJF91_11600 [Allorhizobium taibaishanense]|uniref:Uncharacterized protein n=1 Tax=Allorhizobium taibaishanense TaxID=887144 RepID=A0A1Q9A5Y4_9HYPH|nr:hypothetical protein BJF91_11600 [Allorhizobium taibaishanense]
MGARNTSARARKSEALLHKNYAANLTCYSVISAVYKTHSALKYEKPAAGGGAAGFSKTMNDDWEEECRHSDGPLWEEEKLARKSKLGGRRSASLRWNYIYLKSAQFRGSFTQVCHALCA